MTFNGVMFTEAPQIKHTQFTKTSPISTNMAAKKSPLPQHVDQWKLHCARLTTAQLSSPDAMRDYITAFQSTIGGLDSTQLVGHDAATANVAGFLNKAPSVPSAGALRQLAEESRQVIVSGLIQELTDIATKASCNGETKVPATYVKTLALGKYLESSEVTALCKQRLESAGFTFGLMGNASAVPGSMFTLKWT